MGHSLIQVLDSARRGEPLPHAGARVYANAKPFQLAALLTFVATNPAYASVTEGFFEAFSQQALVTRAATTGGDTTGGWGELWRRTRDRAPIPRHLVAMALDTLYDGPSGLERLACWLVLAERNGLAKESVVTLTDSLVTSGTVVDLRTRLPARPRLVRRYPTGTISEKVALTLPPLLHLVAKEYSICSPVIVARSLGFAGGTWDKLSAIPGFTFAPLDDLACFLASSSVAYCVPADGLAPADAELYAFRAATGTVDSLDLIAASVASKQLALPVDHLLLDIQVGEGGYVADRPAANHLVNMVGYLSVASAMQVAGHVRAASCLTGSCIGPALEVLETLAVLGATGPDYTTLAPDQLERQRRVTAAVATDLISAAVDTDRRALYAWALEALTDGSALMAFLRILADHHVEPHVLKRLATEPRRVLRLHRTPLPVRAPTAGFVEQVDIRAIGRLVNLDLGAGTNAFLGTHGGQGGVQLLRFPGDLVRAGEPLALLSPPQSDAPAAAMLDWRSTLLDCFHLSRHESAGL
jgi:thymidine phosphorylase